MKKTLFIIILYSIISCKNNKIVNDNLNKKLFVFFKENINKADSTLHLDSVIVLKLDSVRQSDILYKRIINIYDITDENSKNIKTLISEAHTDLQLVSLSAGLDRKLYDNYLDEAKQKKEQWTELMHTDSLLFRKADSLTEIEKKSDTTKLLFWQVKCLIQYQRKDLSIKRDTGYAFLNLNKDIVRKEDVF